jgi:hypothetical protein
MTVFGSILILVSSVSKYRIIPALDDKPDDDFLEAILITFIIHEITIYKSYEKRERSYLKRYDLDRR